MSSVSLVTGCSRGLGLEFVRQLVQQQADTPSTIIATCRSPDSATELTALAAQAKGVHVLALDVSDEASIAQLPGALKGLDVERIHLLVHNAGISAPTHPVDPAASAKASVMGQCFSVNAVGPLLLTQTLLPLLRTPWRMHRGQ